MGSKSRKKAAKKPTQANVSQAATTTQKGIIMTPEQQNSIEAKLNSIDAKLGELVQIETYLANKALEASKPAPLAPAPALAAQPAAAPTAPAAPAAPAAPPSRPGNGTVGALVWDYCDGLNKQLGRAPTKEELLAAIKQYSPTLNGAPVNELTAATQYSKWRSSQGLPKLPRGFGAQRQAAAPATPAAVPTPSAPTIGAQPAPAPVAPAPQPVQLPIPAAAVPSVIAPTALPTAAATPQVSNLPPWLRAGVPSGS